MMKPKRVKTDKERTQSLNLIDLTTQTRPFISRGIAYSTIDKLVEIPEVELCDMTTLVVAVNTIPFAAVLTHPRREPSRRVSETLLEGKKPLSFGI